MIWLAAPILLVALVFSASAEADPLSEQARLIELVPGRARIVATRDVVIYFDEDGISNNNSWSSECIAWLPSDAARPGAHGEHEPIQLAAGDFLSVDRTNADQSNAEHPVLGLTVHRKDSRASVGPSFEMYCVHVSFALVASSDVREPTVRDLVRAFGRRVALDNE